MTVASPESRAEPPLVARLDRYFSVVENIFNAIAGIAIMFLMFFAVYQVLGRKVFNAPIFGYIDWVEQIMILFAFLGAAYCQRLGGHVRMELFITNFRGRLLWLVEVFGVVVGLAIISVLIPTSIDHFARAWDLGDSTINAELPIWPAKLLIPVAFTALWIRLVLQLIGYFRLLINPRLMPSAVPLIASVEEEAAKEIQDALGGEAKGEGSK
jgi:TRAP-type mannitol/chloroaromatic compound transport system permease small subunit